MHVPRGFVWFPLEVRLPDRVSDPLGQHVPVLSAKRARRLYRLAASLCKALIVFRHSCSDALPRKLLSRRGMGSVSATSGVGFLVPVQPFATTSPAQWIEAADFLEKDVHRPAIRYDVMEDEREDVIRTAES